MIIEQTCTDSICHNSTTKAGGLDMESPGLASRLIGVEATYEDVEQNPQDCPTSDPEILIDPNDIHNSLFVRKLENRQLCGEKMPNTLENLSQEQIQCFRDWVEELVAENAGAGGAGGSTD